MTPGGSARKQPRSAATKGPQAAATVAEYQDQTASRRLEKGGSRDNSFEDSAHQSMATTQEDGSDNERMEAEQTPSRRKRKRQNGEAAQSQAKTKTSIKKRRLDESSAVPLQEDDLAPSTKNVRTPKSTKGSTTEQSLTLIW